MIGQLTMENEILKKPRAGWGQASGKTDHDRRTQSQLPSCELCKILDVSRSSYYKVPKLKKGDQVILTAIEKLLRNGPTTGIEGLHKN